MFIMHYYLCSVSFYICISLGLLYIFCGCFFMVLILFSHCATSEEIGREEHLQNDLFFVEYDVKP